MKKNKIKMLLIKAGVTPELIGYNYLAEAIAIVKGCIKDDKPTQKNFMQIYKEIADKFSVSTSGVERNMRTALQKALANDTDLFSDLFSVNSNVTLSCFVYTLAQYLILEEVN